MRNMMYQDLYPGDLIRVKTHSNIRTTEDDLVYLNANDFLFILSKIDCLDTLSHTIFTFTPHPLRHV